MLPEAGEIGPCETCGVHPDRLHAEGGGAGDIADRIVPDMNRLARSHFDPIESAVEDRGIGLGRPRIGRGDHEIEKMIDADSSHIGIAVGNRSHPIALFESRKRFLHSGEGNEAAAPFGEDFETFPRQHLRFLWIAALFDQQGDKPQDAGLRQIVDEPGDGGIETLPMSLQIGLTMRVGSGGKGAHDPSMERPLGPFQCQPRLPQSLVEIESDAVDTHIP